MKLMIINGSLGGRSGNSAKLIEAFCKLTAAPAMSLSVRPKVFHLADQTAPSVQDLHQHDAYLFVTGTYWDSWGSPLQSFFEKSTHLEGDACWFGKPCGVVTTMHSVGGKEISNRLQGVLNSFGLFVPPMSAMTYSLVSQLAQTSKSEESSDSSADFSDDFWSLDDLKVIAKNLQIAAEMSSAVKFMSWPVDRADPQRIWLKNVSS